MQDVRARRGIEVPDTGVRCACPRPPGRAHPAGAAAPGRTSNHRAPVAAARARQRDPPVRRELAPGHAQHPAATEVVRVSRRAVVSPAQPGSTRSPANRPNATRVEHLRPTATDASSRISRRPPARHDRPGSASYGVSVVPSRSIPCHGNAKVTRTSSCGIVSAADQGRSAPGSRCTPFDRRADGRVRRVLEATNAVDPRPGRVHHRARLDGDASRRSGGRAPRRRGRDQRPAERDDLGVVATTAPASAAARTFARQSRPSFVHAST